MIVSGGENVFPAEIEELLGAARVDPGGGGDRRRRREVRAAAARRSSCCRRAPKLTEDDVKGYVKDNLASYKVPREVVFLDELPRNPTGKVLKRELAEQGDETPGPVRTRRADESEREGEGEDLARVALEEAEHPAPGVLARFRVVLVAPVEERVRRAGIDVDLVIEPGLGQLGVELLDLLDRDPLVRATEQPEQRHRGCRRRARAGRRRRTASR